VPCWDRECHKEDNKEGISFVYTYEEKEKKKESNKN
jgi:hypothetical protein